MPFAFSVGSAELAARIRAAEPIDIPIAFRFPASTRRHYERIRLPGNLVVLGDSLCSLNPVYGQGMTVAALEALALARQLSGARLPPSRATMRELAKIVDVPWRLAGAVDRAFLPSGSTAGPPRPGRRCVRRPSPGGRRARLGRRPSLLAGVRTDRPTLHAHAAEPGVAQSPSPAFCGWGWFPRVRRNVGRPEPGELAVSVFTLGVVLAAALLRPVLALVGAVLAARLLWRRYGRS